MRTGLVRLRRGYSFMRLNSDPEVRNESLPGHLSKRLVPSLFALFALIVAVIPFLWRLFLPGPRFSLPRPAQRILSRLFMPKAIARRKTKKAVAKRFKVTGTGKVLRSQAGKRHFLVSKSGKRKRQLAKIAVVDKTDEARIKDNLPFA